MFWANVLSTCIEKISASSFSSRNVKAGDEEQPYLRPAFSCLGAGKNTLNRMLTKNRMKGASEKFAVYQEVDKTEVQLSRSDYAAILQSFRAEVSESKENWETGTSLLEKTITVRKLTDIEIFFLKKSETIAERTRLDLEDYALNVQCPSERDMVKVLKMLELAELYSFELGDYSCNAVALQTEFDQDLAVGS